MERYRNLGGRSNVHSYEIGDDHIIIRFNDGMLYRYTSSSSGDEGLSTMKTLARGGMGLNAYINKYMRKRYESKSR